jgi:hypothetical protein
MVLGVLPHLRGDDIEPFRLSFLTGVVLQEIVTVDGSLAGSGRYRRGFRRWNWRICWGELLAASCKHSVVHAETLLHKIR